MLTIPVGALVRADGGWATFCIKDNRAQLTPVQIGAITDDKAEVVTGLLTGQAVVVFPSDKVGHGVMVRQRRAQRQR